MNNYLKIAAECILQNKELVKKKLVIHNFGNVSLKLDNNHFIIKPSGADLQKLKPNDMPVINIYSKKKLHIFLFNIHTCAHLCSEGTKKIRKSKIWKIEFMCNTVLL